MITVFKCRVCFLFFVFFTNLHLFSACQVVVSECLGSLGSSNSFFLTSNQKVKIKIILSI